MKPGIKAENTNKIAVTGDRNHPLISALLSLPTEQREILKKALYIELWDGYPFQVYEIPNDESCL